MTRTLRWYVERIDSPDSITGNDTTNGNDCTSETEHMMETKHMVRMKDTMAMHDLVPCGTIDYMWDKIGGIVVDLEEQKYPP